MEKKFKFSDKSLLTKIIYAAVIAILCITAIIVGIVSAAQKDNGDNLPDDTPQIESPDDSNGDTQTPGDSTDDNQQPEEQQTFVSPLVGSVVIGHSLETPVFSNTLGAWKVHTGIDISAEVGAAVYASSSGVVSGIYNDPMLGYTVEITHPNNIKTRYSNLTKDDTALIAVGDSVESGDRIGTVGDTSISELADESHLHFEVLLKDVKVNPLDYISKESKEASLGIKD